MTGSVLTELKEQFMLAAYQHLYPEVTGVVGCYKQSTNRIILIVRIGHKTQTRSYPRAIFEIHIGRKLNYPHETVDHINSDPMDNRIENLQILSLSENARKAHTDGVAYRTPKGTKVQYDSNGEASGKAKITNDAVLEYRRLYTNGMSKHQISSETGLCRRTVENFLFGVSFKNVPEACQRRRETRDEQQP